MSWQNSGEKPQGARLNGGVIGAVLLVQVLIVAAVVFFALRGLTGGDDGGSGDASAKSVAPAHRFDPRGALALARYQVGAGQRPAGSPALRRVAVRLRKELPNGRFEDIPGQPGLRNIVGTLPGPGPVIVFAAHYDTESHPKGFVGANDAAAAVGTVIELSRTLRKMKRPATAPGIRFVLFDGEEEPHDGDDFATTALRGSRAYVRAHAEEVRALILLDYMGHKGLRLPREGSSDEDLWKSIRTAAQRAGQGRWFPDGTGASIMDDHTPFLEAGIPAVDLIDWNYRYRDTVHDTLDKLDARSIDAVGETLAELVVEWDRRVAADNGGTQPTP